MLAARLPAHSTSTGKVLLAYAGPQYVLDYLDEMLPRYTSQTITTREALLTELEQVRQQGYARSWGEHEAYVRALGAPIRDRTGTVVAAMSISGLATRIDEKTAEEMVQALKRACAGISAGLGYMDR
jgi:IclR family pca regulon transcriptional regulator